ncbi:MAG: hypothetical protein JW833_12285 [Prolixibacteraceae bacterium]|nr:hypothetical protein [Prolixibacteraceae bacterium]
MEIIKKYFENPDLLNKETLAEFKKLTEEFPHFQTAWILYLKNLKVLNHTDFQKELEKNSVRISNREKLYYFLNSDTKKVKFDLVAQDRGLSHSGEYFSEKMTSEKNKVDDLITNFIASQPSLRIKKEDSENVPGNDFSAESVTENEDFITETFAEILVQQKKYDKATEAFQKLSLKFPEKSIYFAGRIEEINMLKN